MALFAVSVWALAAAPCAGGAPRPDLFGHKPGIWQIAGPPDQERWVVIHHLQDARRTGVFHLEVLGRRRGRPKWSVEHVRDHMAITADALARSALRPLDSGAVYPESFDSAFAEWSARAERGEAPVCRSSVVECLRGP